MAPTRSVEIRWTAFGVPHIQAADEQGLGYGIGYAYARDNLCLLADEVLTVRGERARFLGREGHASSGLDNLSSDLFFRWLNRDQALAEFRAAQSPAVRQLLSGYVKGFNRYLADTAQPASCRGAAWLRPLHEDDLVRLVRRLLVEGGLGQFVEALLGAAPPGASAARVAAPPSLARLADFRLERGSNAIAVGGQRTENGKGRLLANPHFPWSGGMRFYQMHLTIPGRLDVMGAALPGLPVVNIGFNRHLAWTHTVDNSSHFTLHRLALDPKDPTRYLFDGRSLPLSKTTLQVEVREADGSLSTERHTLYESRFGPLLNWPGKLDWNLEQAFALQDVNLANHTVLEQWLAINRATDVGGLRSSIETYQGIPWVNTLAADDQGQALYFNGSRIPHIPLQRLSTCALPALVAEGLPGLDGSRSECDWQNDSGAAAPGVVAASHLPLLQREDFVQNSNDSAWLSNPQQPLSGFSPLVSRDAHPLGLRARYALEQLGKQGDQPFSEAFLKALVDDNRVYQADLLLDDLLAFCASRARDAQLAPGCSALASWNRKASLDAGAGFLYFQRFMAALELDEVPWRVPFDPADPLNTPRGLAWRQANAASRLSDALRQASREVADAGLPAQATWGQVQGVQRGSTWIPIPGGDGRFGIYNAMQSERQADGRLAVVSGSSYLQLVSFDDRGPVAQGLLAFSQSSDPASAHFKDQTELFTRQAWRRLPFTRAQIDADPELQVLSLQMDD
ncbi:acylase [Pseudomonas sp. PA15(2017)]|nr:acylase [Pseudomonas sp. PA15(2017)]OLU26429.1 acylase [Pseudomonas sp. PA15(2017)]